MCTGCLSYKFGKIHKKNTVVALLDAILQRPVTDRGLFYRNKRSALSLVLNTRTTVLGIGSKMI
jgi:hypothetical protein